MCFRCLTNGKCIPPDKDCNGQHDCPDGSDEAPIHCNDLVTTRELLNVMGCSSSSSVTPVQNMTGTGTVSPSPTLMEKPEECSYHLKYGVKCNGSAGLMWTQIPWEEFDPISRTISLYLGVLNTSLFLGQEDSSLNESLVVPREFPDLNYIYINNNHIEAIGPRAFCFMDNLCLLSLSGNGIRNLSQEAFCPMPGLRTLALSNNSLGLSGFQFRNMSSLGILRLQYNVIEEIHEDMFSQLTNLTFLDISHNRIRFIHPQAFSSNHRLMDLGLTGNQLSTLSSSLFLSQSNLKRLQLSDNPLISVEPSLLAPLTNLSSLNVNSYDLSQLDVSSLNSLPVLSLVFFKKFSYCQFVPRVQRCYPNSDGLSSTSNLLIGQSRITVWLIGLLTLLGNVFVLASRWSRGRRSGGRTEITEILNIFVTNLALADLLMGLYLLTLAGKDVQFRGMYSVKAYEWSTSYLCSGIGILAWISSEVSLLILTIMSLERYLTIGGTFSRGRNLNVKLARLSMLIIWLFAGVLALAPAWQWQGANTPFYGSTGLCFPIHLDDQYPTGWQYTTFVFIGVNSVCFLLITVSYSLLFLTVQRTQRRTPLLAKNIELAARFFLMVVTDVLCWAPIILLKFWVLFGYELSKETIGLAVIYILPLNSAVNPILYTFSTNEVRHAMTTSLNRLMENFELNQLIPASSHSNSHQANSIELQGIGIATNQSWLGRLFPRRRREQGDGQQGNHTTTAAREDTELTHSICPTIMTTDNSCIMGGGGGMDSVVGSLKLGGIMSGNNCYNDASLQVSRSPSQGTDGGSVGSNLLSCLDELRCYDDKLSPLREGLEGKKSPNNLRK